MILAKPARCASFRASLPHRFVVVARIASGIAHEAARILGRIGRGKEAVEAGLADYGMHVGTAFQLIDDVLDYSGEVAEIGKSLGDDLAEGKPTLPLIYAMRAGSKEQADLVRRAIREGGREDFAPVLAAIRDCGALDYARQAAEREAALATRALEPLAASEYKDSLLELAAFSVTRRS
jgi:octaprenyl-diphosphate synthase